MSENETEPMEAKLVLNPQLVEAVAEFEHVQLNYIAGALINKGAGMEEYLSKILIPYADASEEVKEEARSWARAVGKIFLGAMLTGKLEVVSPPVANNLISSEDQQQRISDLIRENDRLRAELKAEKELRQLHQFKADCYSQDCWKTLMERDEARQELCQQEIKDIPFGVPADELLDATAHKRGWYDLFDPYPHSPAEVIERRNKRVQLSYAANQLLTSEAFSQIVQTLELTATQWPAEVKMYLTSFKALLKSWQNFGGQLHGK